MPFAEMYQFTLNAVNTVEGDVHHMLCLDRCPCTLSGETVGNINKRHPSDRVWFCEVMRLFIRQLYCFTKHIPE